MIEFKLKHAKKNTYFDMALVFHQHCSIACLCQLLSYHIVLVTVVPTSQTLTLTSS